MAQDIVNENQNLNYTNLDFSSIYTEVLDMVKQLTKKWDPSISDESDPGVVLVKLSALLADKCNYNIDKNILEAFPLSVTQDSNARQLYEQLGYYMHWYKAATVPVTINWKTTTVGEDGNANVYTIPKFTTVTDDDETVIYSLIGTEGDSDVVVSDGLLYSDSSKNLNMIAYEGAPVRYTFNDRTTITPNMVDTNNRLYLSTSYVFENGIFIKNVEQDNYAEWHRVDNLYEYSYNIHRYKFGYDSASNLCYLEFPDNYAELFGSGIEVTYLTFTTDESFSDVPIQFLSKFLGNVNVNNDEITLTQDIVSIANTEPASGHADKEDINSAYNNYKKVVGTFNTLITLRDYLNYLRSNELDICSNAFVTDRTNDVQSSYKIINKQDGVESLITEIERDEDNFQFVKTTDADVMSTKTYYTFDAGTGNFVKVSSPSVANISSYYEKQGEEIMPPFSLKIYLLQKAVALTNRGAYDDTFNMTNDAVDMDALLENTSHLVHNFDEILPIGENVYEVTNDPSVTYVDGHPTKIYYRYDKVQYRYEPVPVTSLTYQMYNPHAMGLYERDTYYQLSSDTEWYDSKTYYAYDISTNTYSIISPHPEEGSPKSSGAYELIEEYTLTSDVTIDSTKTYYEYDPSDKEYKVATLPSAENPDAINPHNLGLYEVSEEALLPRIVFFKNKYPLSMSVATYSAVNATTKTDILMNIINAFYKNLDSSNIEFGDSISLDYLTEIAKNADSRVKNVAFDAITYTTYAVYWDGNQKQFIEIELPKTMENVDYASITNLPTFDNVTAYLFGKDIICKSILAGVTQLIIPDDTFAYHLNQKYMGLIPNIKYVTGEAIIDMNNQDSYYMISSSTNPRIMKSYTLQENETLTLFRPMISDVETYSSGVHYEYKVYSDILTDQSYQLTADEYFIFYTTNLDNDGVLQSFTVYVYGDGAIIRPTFDIEARTALTTYGDIAVSITATQGANTDTSVDTNVYSYTESRAAQVSQINNDTSINNTKIGTNDSISAQSLNRFTLKEGEGYRLVWKLNTPIYDGQLKQYQLFPGFDSSSVAQSEVLNSYTLKSGEYLYYTDATLSTLGVLGAGTTIYRNCGTTTFDYSDIDSTYLFVKWTDLVSSGLSSGFTELTRTSGGTQVLSPVDMGFYVEDSGTMVRSEDELYDNSKTYYLLLMRSMVGNYIKSDDDTYSPVTSLNTSVFSAVDIKDQYPNTDVDPSALGLYERVTSVSGEDITDSYGLVSLSCDSSSDYADNPNNRSIEGTYYRYASTLDDSVLTRSLFTRDDGNMVTIGDKSTYGNITIYPNDESSIGKYSPNKNGWLLDVAEESEESEEQSFMPATYDDTLFEELSLDYTSDVTNKGYFYKTSASQNTYNYATNLITTSYAELSKSQLSSLITQYVQEINNDKTCVELIDAVDEDYKLIYQIDTNTSDFHLKQYELSSVKVITDALGEYVPIDTDFLTELLQQDTSVRQYVASHLYFGFMGVPTTTVPDYVHEGSITSSSSTPGTFTLADTSSSVVTIVGTVTDSLNNVTSYTHKFYVHNPDTFYPIDGNTNIKVTLSILYATSTLSPTISVYGDSGYTNTVSKITFSGYKVPTVQCFLKVDSGLINTYLNDGVGYLNSSSIVRAYQVEVENSNEVFVPLDYTSVGSTATIYSSDEDAGTTVAAYTDISSYLGQGCKISFNTVVKQDLDTDWTGFYITYNAIMSSLQSWFNTLSDYFTDYTTATYYMLVWYQFNEWYGYKKKTYYALNEYASKSFGDIDPYVCPAVDSLQLTSNPMGTLKKLFQSVQTNTSLTFTQNQLWTLSQGDIVTFDCAASDTSNTIDFPIFSNKEVILDLDKFNVTYKRVGGDTTSLNNITIDNCDWKGYSNLLLNTNNNDGQPLLHNQSLTLYGEDMSDEIGHVSGTEGTNVYFQLQYPVSNVAGEYIEVDTFSITQENILNTLYVYNVSSGETDKYVFSSDDHKTYIYVKKSDASIAQQGITIQNVLLPAGDYLIPVNGFDDLRIELTYNPRTIRAVVSVPSSVESFDELTFLEKTGYRSLETYVFTKSGDNWVTDIDIEGEPMLIVVDLIDYGIVPADSAASITVTTTSASSSARKLTSYIDNTKDYFLGDKLHFAYLQITETDVAQQIAGTLNVQIKNPDGSNITQIDISRAVTVILEDVFKFEQNPLLVNSFDDIKEKLIRLDVDQKYDYTHVTNADDIIQDPMVPKTFWDKNHVYNEFTIAQLNADSIEPKFIT